ncbi:hypothetical protein [Malacoplasma muris]|uniref:hypothetical protein n=1 Tax=Malacoplasma muris TaxID=2119 RepID=UPI00398F2D28
MKNKVKIALILCTSLSVVSAPILMTSCSTTMNSRYYFNGQSFNSRDELDNYLVENTKINNYTKSYADSWSLNNYSGGSTTYTNIIDAKKEITKNITKIDAQIPKSVYDRLSNNSYFGSSNELLDNDYAEFDTSNSELVQIYQGNNDSYYYDGMHTKFSGEELAKLSYMKENLLYYFDDTYFPDKQSLRWYLTNDYFSTTGNSGGKGFINDKINADKSVRAGNGNLSVGVQYQSDGTIKNSDAIKSFIRSNINEVYEYTKKDGTKQYFNKNDYNSIRNKLSTSDIPYYKYNKNNGSSYIVDTRFDDLADFFGPYFVNGAADIEGIINTDNWTKDKNYNSKNAAKYSIYQVIADEFSLLFNDNSITETRLGIKTKNWFNIFGFETKIQQYEDKIKNENSNFYKFLTDQLTNIALGKRFNIFFKIPIMYSLAKEYVFKNNLSYNLLNFIREYFIFICDRYTDVIHAFFPENLLKRRLGNQIYSDKFDLKNIYGLDSPTFDYSGDMYYFIDVLIEYYPSVLTGMIAFTAGYNNINHIAGLSTFKKNSINDFLTLLKKHFPMLLKDYSILNYDDYMLLYNRASSDSMDKLLTYYDKNQDLNKIYSTLFTVLVNNTKFKNVMDYAIKNKDDNLLNIAAKYFNGYLYCTIVSGIEDNVSYSYISNAKHWLINSSDYEEFIKIFFGFQNKIYSNIDKIDTYESSAKQIIQRGNSIIKNIDSYSIIEKSSNNNEEGNKIRTLLNANVNLSSNKEYVHSFYNLTDKFTKTNQFQIDKDKYDFARHVIEDIIFPYFDITLAILDLATSGIAGLFFDIFKFAYNMIMPEFVNESYTFSTDDGKHEYVWNGGQARKWLYGFVNENIQDISAMKLIQPVKYSEPRKDDYLYFGNKTYGADDINLLANDYINSLVYESNNNAIKKVYTFDTIKIGDENKNILNTMSLDKEQLVNEIYNSVLAKEERFLSNVVFNYEGGYYATNDKTAIEMAIEEIDQNIEPIKVSVLPSTDANGYVDTTKEIKYQLPGNSFDVESKKILSPQEKNIVGINFLETHVKNWGGDYTELDQHRHDFIDRVKVKSKFALKSSLLKTDNYTDVDSDVIKTSIYEAKSYNGDVKYFLTEQQAYNWLSNTNKFAAAIVTKKETVYEIFDNKFYSYTEYEQWVNNNIKVGV